MLLILDEHDKPRTPDEYDQIVRAKIPDKEVEPQLYHTVLKHMIHGPCGVSRRTSPCMENGVCKRKYPKQFCLDTIQGNYAYPLYRRREVSHSVPLQENGNTYVGNRWVVPYNAWLLLKYDCHRNVEICNSIKSVKYLYKYVHKGPDRVAMILRLDSDYNEIQQFVDARWVCAPEAFWRLYMFPLYKMCPSVERIQLHLPNMQHVRYQVNRSIEDILEDTRNSRTMLTEFFKMNIVDPEARNFLYREFPNNYQWISASDTWRKRVSNQRAIGRIYNASPIEGERFFLRVLLNHVRGPQSFEHLRTVGGVTYPTFKEGPERLGLLEYDRIVRDCLTEACTTRMTTAIRRLFVTMLVYCKPARVHELWDEFFPYMAEDYHLLMSASNNVDFIRCCVLCDMD